MTRPRRARSAEPTREIDVIGVLVPVNPHHVDLAGATTPWCGLRHRHAPRGQPPAAGSSPNTSDLIVTGTVPDGYRTRPMSM